MRLARRAVPLALLLALPLLANWQAVSGWLQRDPIYVASGLAQGVVPGPLQGFTSQDPNDGWTTEALGHLAAEQWLSGRVPWWNPYSGVGLPLAAEMQCSALFLPFVLLLHFAQGPLLLKLAMQAVAGLATWGLLRALGLGRLAALTGGALFELNGTFAWFGDAPMLPVAFLPLLLLGVEGARRAALGGGRGGWPWVSVALAFSLYAGFPETAYLDGLLALAWAALRLAQLPSVARVAFAAKVAAGGVTGLLLAAPVLLPFLHLLSLGDVGSHTFTETNLPVPGLAALLAPYLLGIQGTGAFFDPASPAYWIPGRLGGYTSVAALLLALLGVVGRRERGLRWLLIAWCALALGRTAGLPGFAALVNAVPLMTLTEVFRYAAPSWELALVVLAAFALDDTRESVGKGAVLLAASMSVVAFTAACFGARPVIAVLLARSAGYSWWLWGSLAWSAGGGATAILLLLGAPCRERRLGVAALLTLDALVVFTVPGFSAPRRAGLDEAVLRFLSQNAGAQRFHSLGPFLPNYGAYFRLPSIDAFYVPTPRRWSDQVTDALDPYAGRQTFGGGVYPPWLSDKPNPGSVLLTRSSAYEELGVRYILAGHGTTPFAEAVLSSEVGSGNRAEPLFAGQGLSGTFPADRLKAGRVASVGVVVGTYGGAANGRLAATLCTAATCSSGTAALAGAPDNGILQVQLSTPLDVAPGAALQYRFLHVDGSEAVALWLWPEPDASGATRYAPRVALSYAGPAPPVRVYADALVDMYELPHPKPYWEIRDGDCTLAPVGRETVTAECRGPALLLRRELAYPGWHATINGVRVPVGEAPPLFQAVHLPAGRSEVRFRYWPPYIGWACAAAALGLAALAAVPVSQWRRPHRTVARSLQLGRSRDTRA